MNSSYTKTEKSNLINRHLAGESIASILATTSIPRSTFYAWVKQYRDENQAVNPREFTLKNFRILSDKVVRLEGIIKILHVAECAATAPLGEKLAVLELLHGQYPVRMLCDALNVSRGTFYNHILRNKRDDAAHVKRREALKIRIREIYDDNDQILGAGKIAAVIRSEGNRVSETMVSGLMRELDITSIRQEAKSLHSKEKRKTINRLNQEFYTDKPNQVWVSDVTYFRFKGKNYCVCVIIDLFSRRVVGHKISFQNSTQLVKATFIQAYKIRSPGKGLIFHTDRGSNYRSNAFCEYLKSLSIKQSFSRSSMPYDNAVAESFFASMKKEELYRRKYRSEKEFRQAVDDYMVFYNTKRPHQTLKYKTPEQAEAAFANDNGYCDT